MADVIPLRLDIDLGIQGLRVLVCGGRKFNDPQLLGSWLGGIHKQHRIICIIEGGAAGADRMARLFANWAKILVKTYSANWQQYGPAAGAMRNQRMLVEGKPDLVVAFPGGAGTADMVRKARAAGVPVLDVTAPQNVARYECAIAEFEEWLQRRADA